jgi:uncharacterized Zn-binding protein involved in type VI secretion
MPPAARLSDPATHLMTPIAPGICSMDVTIGFMKAWRALPAGMGAGVESAMNTMKGLMDAATLDPVSTPLKLTQMNAALMQDAASAEANGAAGATGAVSGGFTTVTTANVAATTAYTSAAAVPGGEPAARQAYTLAMKAAAAAFTSAAMSAIAGMTDIHICPQPSGPIPHGPGVVTKGSKTVFINGLPACREGDKIFEAAGGPDPIKLGCQTVLIGDDGGSASPASPVQEAVEQAVQDAKTQSSASALVAAAGAGTPLIEICEPCQQMREVAQKQEKKHKVAFRIVDDETNRPVAGVTLKVTLPDGSVETCRTGADGTIEIDDLEQPGSCSVTCDSKGAARANTYDFVRMGEGAGVVATPAEEATESASTASTPPVDSGTADSGTSNSGTGDSGTGAGENATPAEAPMRDHRDLSNYAQSQGFTVTSTTGGTHNPGSAHGAGRAIDVRTRDKTDAEVDAFIADARRRGIHVRDERSRPPGQAVWSGPHVHLEIR